jgi:SAM-dependent methyltransferase
LPWPSPWPRSWIRYGQVSAFAVVPIFRLGLLLAGLVLLSTVNLVIRWFRWHFLTRQVVQGVPTRTSLMLYFGTLPAFATPLYLGELLRTALVARRIPEARRVVFTVWFVERLADAAALLLFVLAARAQWLVLTLLAAGACALLVLTRKGAGGQTARALLRSRNLSLLGVTSTAAWLMPVAGLWIIARQLGDPISGPAAAEVFSLGTLLGGVALLPLGAGVTGSSMILQLQSIGVSSEASIVVVALLRLGTTWYALALGVFALLRWRREIVSIARQRRPQQHFDELAAEYGDQIPAHVRERVVGRKVAAMEQRLRDCGVEPGARGLDLGCGQGWYAVEMARLGYAMRACDRSPAQVEQARRFIAAEEVQVEAVAADACALPYPDGSFEFVYGVNVIHHITDPGGLARALREAVRVLRPGGSFFLHEINTENPLFAFYMGYVFPLIREIDDGTEAWIRPSALPDVEGAHWAGENAYMTFLPDFTPRPLLGLLSGLEGFLERSRFRTWSAHYVARLVKRAE